MSALKHPANLIGMRHGLRQPILKLQLNVNLSKELLQLDLGTWIGSAFETNLSDYKILLLPNVGAEHVVLDFVEKLLLTWTLLSQDVRIPLFERAAVEQIREDEFQSGIYKIVLWLPWVGPLDRAFVRQWLVLSSRLMISGCQLANQPKALEDFYQSFHKSFIEPKLRLVPGGKSTIPILQAAWSLDIPFANLAAGRYVLGWGCKSRIFELSSNTGDSVIGARATQRKDIAIQIMRGVGLPVPNGVVLNPKAPLQNTFAELKRPLVVKPVDRDRGEGVVLDIHTQADLDTAIQEAGKLSKAVIVEEQLPGTCYRILVVDGQIVYVVKRNPRGVTGDGIKTIAELIEQEKISNHKKLPIKRLPEVELDHLACLVLDNAGLHPGFTPRLGARVALRPVQSAQWGGDPQEVTNQLHPDNAEIAIRAARLFGLSCAGVDFISSDISEPWYVNGAVINEVNYSPVLGRTHPYQREGIKRYLEIIFKDGAKIPIEIFVGSRLIEMVNARLVEFNSQRTQVFLCRDKEVFDHRGQLVRLSMASNLFQNIAMLRANTSVQAIIVHIEHDVSFLEYGLPFEYVSQISAEHQLSLSASQTRLVAMLTPYLRSGKSVEHVAFG